MSEIEKECKHYDNYFSELQTCNINTTDCENINNCYYKQTQQLKQQLQLEKDNVAELNKLLISYKEENEELKRQCESLKGLITVGGKQQFALTQRVDELEQKLEKIKDYCKNKTLSYCDCSKDILQIIEGDNNE